MEDIKILEAVERYISGHMSPDERVYFEQLRKSNAEVDQLVVEHTYFLQQLSRFDEVRRLKSELNEIHFNLIDAGTINPDKDGTSKVIALFHKYKRVSAIAASIAGLTVLSVAALIWSIAPVKPANKQDIISLSRDIKTIDQKVNQIHRKNQELDQKLTNVAEQAVNPTIEYKSGGTGFLVDVKGYVVTNAHVVKGSRHVAVQAANGDDISATVVHMDEERDIAILKLTGKNYKSPASIPYSIRNSGGKLAEPIFTLGYPRNDIVYGDGYIASKTGYNGDTLSLQITIPANRGNSGSPILNRNGEVIGILSKKERTAEGVAFAIRSKYITAALEQLHKSQPSIQIKVPTSSSLKGVDRTHQVEKITDYIYLVKVDS